MPAVVGCRSLLRQELCPAQELGRGRRGEAGALPGQGEQLPVMLAFSLLIFSKCPAHAFPRERGQHRVLTSPPHLTPSLVRPLSPADPTPGCFLPRSALHIRAAPWQGRGLGRRLFPVSQQGESVPRRAQRQLCPEPGQCKAGMGDIHCALCCGWKGVSSVCGVSRLSRSQCVSLTVCITKDNWVLFVSQLCFGYCCFAVPPISPGTSCCRKPALCWVPGACTPGSASAFTVHVNVYPCP